MRYFTFREFSRSETAERLGIDNSIPNYIEPRIVELADTVLDPLRAAWGSPLRVTSGYRCKELNEAVKGSKTSAHLLGSAADIVPMNGKSARELFHFALAWLTDTDTPFDQIIFEVSGKSKWVHIGVRNGKGKQRRQALYYDNGKYMLV